MEELFEYVLDRYRFKPQKVSNQNSLYQVICYQIPKAIKEIIGERSDIKVFGSMGKGNMCRCPWVALLKKEITTSTKEGIYLVYLFRADMQGFYLSLNQGITYFNERYGRKKYEAAKEVASYFQKEITNSSFSKEEIDLVSPRGDLGYGYMKTNVLSKFYPIHHFKNEELIRDLQEFLNIYDDLTKHFLTNRYEEIVEQVLDYIHLEEGEKFHQFHLSSEDAIKKINVAINPNHELMPREVKVSLQEVEPKAEISHAYKALESKANLSKIDYLSRAAKDAKIGLRGEELVLEFERNRLMELGRLDLADKITWISQRSDAFGYDIESFDEIDEKWQKIQIEVKSTESRVDREFPVTLKEVNTSIEKRKTYFVYRVYDIASISPKLYRVKGAIEDHFELNPITFMARYVGKK